MKDEKIHKNNCPISVAQRGQWAASIPPECNCHIEEIKQAEQKIINDFISVKSWHRFMSKEYEKGFADGLCSEETQRDEHCIEGIKQAKQKIINEIINWTKRLDKDGCDNVSTKKIRSYLESL